MTDQDPEHRDEDALDPAVAHGARTDDPRLEAVIAARLATVAARFGDRWDDDQCAQVRRDIARQVDLATQLRRTPVGNADEPEIVFTPFRAPARPGGSEPR